jgi:hypothetical protein
MPCFRSKNGKEWLVAANDFAKKRNVPICVEAMDGKHISVQAPIGSGNDCFNYKKFFCIVLFAVVDGNCNFFLCKCWFSRTYF